MEYLIILYYGFLTMALWLMVESHSRVIDTSIKAPRPANITADKCPACGNAIGADAIKGWRVLKYQFLSEPRTFEDFKW
jgi:hypothetical protein